MKLKYLINVFNVWPAFLLPVFSNKNKFFFEKIQDNCIQEFIEADLRRFEKSFCFTIQSEDKVSINGKAVYAIGFNESDYIYGDSKLIIDDYHRNTSKYVQNEIFKESFLSFKNQHNTSIMVNEKFNATLSPKIKYNTLIHYGDINYDLKKIFSQKDINKLSLNWYSEINTEYLRITESISGLLEDQIKNSSNWIHEYYSSKKYYKKHRYLLEQKNIEKSIYEILSNWHLNISQLRLTINNEFGSIEILDNFIEQLLLESEQENSKVYFLDMMSLSNKVGINMILAQNFWNKKDCYFKIIERRIFIIDIIEFLELLYKEQERKITILINDNDIYNNPLFYSWTEENNDRFSVKSLPLILGVKV